VSLNARGSGGDNRYGGRCFERCLRMVQEEKECYKEVDDMLRKVEKFMEKLVKG
jgi:hypothetical protein